MLNSGEPVPVHPTQLYLMLAYLLSFVLLIFLYEKKKFQGQIILCFLFCYAVINFFIDMLRIDIPTMKVFSILSYSQALSIFILIVAIPLYLKSRNKQMTD